MSDPKRGIVNPWARRPVEPVVATPPQDERLAQFDNVPTCYWPLAGQVYTLRLPFLPCKDRDAATDAAETFGACLKKLFAKAPAFSGELFKRQIGATPPLGPKIALTFGDVKLYARANSRDPERATAMAVDRLCEALIITQRYSAPAQAIVEEYGVRIGRSA